MKTFRTKWMVSLVCLPLLGLPGSTGGQTAESNAPDEIQQRAAPAVGQPSPDSVRSGSRRTSGIPHHWIRLGTNEAVVCREAGQLMLHTVQRGTANGAGSPGLAERERPPRIARRVPAGAYRPPNCVEVPPLRPAYTPMARCVPVRPVAVGASGFGKLGSGLAALFGFGAWGASRNRKDGRV